MARSPLIHEEIPMRLRALLAALALAAACDNSGAGLGPDADLTIQAATTDLARGGSVALHATLGGEAAAPGAVRWTSRNPAAATVGPDGVARATGAGVAWVVAEHGDAKDSVRLRVRFGDLAPGTFAAQIAGVSSSLRLGGRAMRIPAGPHSGLGVYLTATDQGGLDPNGDVWQADSLIYIAFPGAIAAGTKSIGAPTVTFDPGMQVRGNGGNVMMRARQPDGSMHVYVPAGDGATVEITRVDEPSAAGVVDGRVVGSVAFEAAAFRLGPEIEDGSPVVTQLSTSTIPVYLEFELTLEEMLLIEGTLALTRDGVTRAGTLFGDGAMHEEGLRFQVGHVFGTAAEATFAALEVWLPNPGPGTTALVPREAPTASGTAGGAESWALFNEGLIAGNGTVIWDVLRSGTITVTEYRAPTPTAWGMAVTELRATFADPSGPTTDVVATMRLPVVPLGRSGL
jgi:hypothetical protein